MRSQNEDQSKNNIATTGRQAIANIVAMLF